MIRKPNEEILSLYIRKILQKPFMKYSQEKKLPRSTILNEMLMQKLSEEGYL